MPSKRSTTHAISATPLDRAQEHASQLLRQAHDTAQAIDRAVRLEAADEQTEGHRASSRIARMRTFGAAQDCKVLASRLMGQLAGADEGCALVMDAVSEVADSQLAAMNAMMRAEFVRDVAQHIVAALTAGEPDGGA